MTTLNPLAKKSITSIFSNTALNDFKIAFAEGCQLSHEGKVISNELLNKIITSFRSVIDFVNNMLYHEGLSQEEQETLGRWLHSEFIAFSLLGTWPSRSLRKPQKIAGDHHTIKQIYDNGNQERRAVGTLVNACFFNEPACQAVINRMQFIVNKITDNVINKNDSTVYQVTSIASGPAEELFEAVKILGVDKRKQFKANCIDLDYRACSSVHDKVKDLKLSNTINVHHGDITKQKCIQSFQNSQDLVYSMGLIDYFKERACIRIVNHMHSMLKPGGEAIVGNFHTSCSSRAFLDYILDWKLVYRTEDDMRAIFLKSDFACEPTIDYEACGVNMLVRCIKQ